MGVLHVPTFSGVVLAGSPAVRTPGALLTGDDCDIGPGGVLIAGTSPQDWATLNDAQTSAQPWLACLALATGYYATYEEIYAAGVGKKTVTGSPVTAFVMGFLGPNTTTGATIATTFLAGTTVPTSYANVTTASFPYVLAGAQQRLLFINFGARGAAKPTDTAGLYVITNTSSGATSGPISNYDALGTGPDGIVSGGTDSSQLFPRGIAAYNNFVFLWGFDKSDADGDGPARLMFSNAGNPLAFGNDNLATSGNRFFSDTDALTIGGAGEVITAGIAALGRLWIGTNKGLHYLQGYGRDSFLTDGTTGVPKAFDVIGPHAMCEGPDGLLYGVCSQGLWRYNAGGVEPLFVALYTFEGRSPGYWDMLWSNPANGDTYPGRTNLDLVQCYADYARRQVCVMIPFCSIANNAGQGADSVLIKYHVDTGGFTRSTISGRAITAESYHKRTAQGQEFLALGRGDAPAVTLDRYGYRANGLASAPADAMTLECGPYLPFGPDGVGTVHTVYVSLAWEDLGAAAVAVTVTPTVNNRVGDAVPVVVTATAPSTPADGSLWVDVSGTDTNLGTGLAGAFTPAHHDFVLKRWVASWSKWVPVPRIRGSKLQDFFVLTAPNTQTEHFPGRLMIPVSFTPMNGTLCSIALTVSGGARTQIEGLGIEPATVREAA